MKVVFFLKTNIHSLFTAVNIVSPAKFYKTQSFQEISQPHQDSIMALFFKHLDHITLQDMNNKYQIEII